MKMMKTVPVPATERQVVDKVLCDICKKECPDPTNKNWSTEVFCMDTVYIQMEIGTYYPEFTHGTKTEYDICTFCFASKIVPFLSSLGAESRSTEWDY